MIELCVDLAERAYPIVIGEGLLDDDALWARLVGGSAAAIVSNETVGPLYAERVRAALERVGKRTVTIVLPDGEAHKTWPSLERIYDALIQARCDRGTTLVALGGGVVGDMTGFAAATYQRGVPYVQVPTTLLAQVDSSVGGKTAINHALGKNMIGAFHQPSGVLIDVSTLETLAAREFSAGLAEVIKHGAACDAAYFAAIEADIGRLMARDPASLARAIEGSCRIKAEVVRADERETGVRALLNFGHTFGHAIEAALGYGTWLHGEAVAAGMVLAATLSEKLLDLEPQATSRLVDLLRRARLPVQPPRLAAAAWLDRMAIDKKVVNGQARLIVLAALGAAEVRPVPESLVLEVLAACRALEPEAGVLA